MVETLKSLAISLSEYKSIILLSAVLFTSISARRLEKSRAVSSFFLAITSPEITKIANITALSVALIYFFTIAANLIFPSYNDHLEPLVAAISWLSLSGQPTHPRWALGEGIYGVLYGPLLYQLNSLSLAAFPSVFGSKILGSVAIAGATFVQYSTIRRIAEEKEYRRQFMLMSIMLMATIEYICIIDRSDPFIMLIASFALYVPFTCTALGASAIVGAAAGLVTAMKLHGFLYVFPAAVFVVCKNAKDFRTFFIRTAAGISCAGLAFIAPFLLPGASIIDFLDYIFVSSRHDLLFTLLRQNLALGAAFFSLPFAAYYLLRPRFDIADRAFLASAALAIMVVAVIASKAGAGPNHIYPFIPTIIVALAMSIRSSRTDEVLAEQVIIKKNIGRILLVLTLCTFGFASVAPQIHYLKLFAAEYHRVVEQRSEIVDIMAQYPKAEMGVSDLAHYEDTFLFPLMVFKSNKLMLNSAAWMDLKEGGVSEEYLYSSLLGCRAPAWVVPAVGVPFSVEDYYDHRPLFSDRFRDLFSENYVLARHGRRYDVWTCRS